MRNALLAAAFSVFAASAFAQTPPAPGWVMDANGGWHAPAAQTAETGNIPLSNIDFSTLGNTPLILVTNLSGVPVTGLDCVNWTTSAVSIPNGILSDKHGAVIEFGRSKCSRTIMIHFGAKTYRLDGYDVSKNTKLEIGTDFAAAATRQ